MRIPGRRGGVAAVIVASLLAQTAIVAFAQEESFRERQVLDPATDEWVDQPTDPATPVGELDEARSELARNEPKKARKRLVKWTEGNAGHERYYEAMFLLGEAYFETGDFYRAYESYQEVAQNSAGELFTKALRRAMDAARAFLSGQKRIVWRVFKLPAYDDGLEILTRVWEQVPGTRMGEEAIKLKADYYFENGDMDLAQSQYVLLTREYPKGRFVRAAMLRSAESSESSFAGVRFDDRPLIDARERYEQVKAVYPRYAEREQIDARLDGIRQQRAQKDLEIAKWYEKTRQPAAAEFYYKRILKDWTGTLAEAEARGRLRAMGADDLPAAESTTPSVEKAAPEAAE